MLQRAKRPDRIAYYESELACPPLPAALAYLWQVYHRLRRRKGGGGFGPSPIEWPDIDAFTRNSRFVLKPWEIEIIEMIDDLYMAQQAKTSREQTRDNKPTD